MASSQIDFLIKLRDASQIIADAANELLKSMIPPELGLETEPATVSELTFAVLKWDVQKGSQLGDFEVGYKASNIEDKWRHAFNILRRSNATIKDRFHGANYSYAYWVYGQDKIYRQKLKSKTTT
jgi:hypothetical protein